MNITGYVTIDMVRQHLQDRCPGDNTIDNDLYWSDEDIMHAMQRAAMEYNAVPPFVHNVSPTALPAHTNVLLYGVLAILYEMGVNKLSRNIMNWTAGDTTVELEKPRLAMFKELQATYYKMFREQAHIQKTEINRNLAYGWM